jgi:hypothetical protein
MPLLFDNNFEKEAWLCLLLVLVKENGFLGKSFLNKNYLPSPPERYRGEEVKSRFFVKDFVEKGCACALSAPVFLVTVLVTLFGNGHETETGCLCL